MTALPPVANPSHAGDRARWSLSSWSRNWPTVAYR